MFCSQLGCHTQAYLFCALLQCNVGSKEDPYAASFGGRGCRLSYFHFNFCINPFIAKKKKQNIERKAKKKKKCVHNNHISSANAHLYY